MANDELSKIEKIGYIILCGQSLFSCSTLSLILHVITLCAKIGSGHVRLEKLA